MIETLPRIVASYCAWTKATLCTRHSLGAVTDHAPDGGHRYIHFLGVSPRHRRQGLARRLYEHFFRVVGRRGCVTVSCVTSPANGTSLAYHLAMGFEVREKA